MSGRPYVGRLCDVKECRRSHHAGGYCALHYRRWKKTGSTDDPPSKSEPYLREAPASPDHRLVNTTHCRNGHPWTGIHHTCPICRRKSSARYERNNAWKRADRRRRN